jgi:hypothetical protein
MKLQLFFHASLKRNYNCKELSAILLSNFEIKEFSSYENIANANIDRPKVEADLM